MALQRYKAAKGLSVVGGEKVVRGYVKMSEERARYHIALGRLGLPKGSKKKVVELTENSTAEAPSEES
ncbi:hypothetical protein [Cohaesibacter marisflavi]|uniref:hypothetical protein n=1 Tax=Cohaesibacter marisflavi TaxID=655353 RepID=UPI0029C6E8B0|nr:hypothetical protein [Cohaesibacter marisflavi]